MADRKITELTALAAGSQATGDLLAIVDVSETAAASKNKKITVESLFKGIPGNVGIGVTSPGAKLELRDNTQALLSWGDTAAIGSLSFDGSSQPVVRALSGKSLVFQTDGSNERMRIDSSGNVGIGASPSHVLDVTTTGNRARFKAGTGNCDIELSSIPGRDYLISSKTDGSLTFFDEDASTERLRIDSSGNVGIGTSSVGALLHASTAGTASTLNEIARIESTAANSGPSFTFHGKQGSDASTKLSGLIGFTQTQNTDSDGRPAFVVHTGNNGSVTEQLRVTHDGNVGIGTTSPSGLLHLAASSEPSLYFEDTGSSNTLSRIYKAGSSLTFNSRHTSAGQFVFNSENSGGTASERMRIDSSGRVLIGTTSNTNSANLDIQLNTVPATDTYSKLQLRSGNYGYILKGGLKQGAGGQLHFDLNNNNSVSTKMVLDTGGRLLVGTTSPLLSTDLISGANSGTVNVSIATTDTTFVNNNNVLFRAQNQQGTRRAEIGVIRKNNNNPSAFLRLDEEDGGAAFVWADNSKFLRISGSSGHIGTTSGTVVGTQTSDLRVKNVGANVGYGLAEVKQLQPKQYALKDDPDVNKLGFIAQEVESIIPEAVFDTREELDGHQEGDRTKLGMEYVQLIPVLVNAIKELSAEVDTLKAKVAALEAG